MSKSEFYKQRACPICTICNFDGVLKDATCIARSLDGMEWFECAPGAHPADANDPFVRASLMTFDEWRERHGMPEAFK